MPFVIWYLEDEVEYLVHVCETQIVGNIKEEKV
jgi:hypothetical protein